MNCQTLCDPDCELGAVHCEWAHLPSHKPGWHSSDSCEEEQLRIELAKARRACKQFREELDRLRAGETCRVGQPAACGDFHTAGQCVREVHPLEREARDEAAKLRAELAHVTGELGKARAQLPECSGICLTGSDVGIPSAAISYPHPDCPLHGDLEDSLRKAYRRIAELEAEQQDGEWTTEYGLINPKTGQFVAHRSWTEAAAFADCTGRQVMRRRVWRGRVYEAREGGPAAPVEEEQ